MLEAIDREVLDGRPPAASAGEAGREVLVIGAGLGGLSAAVRLRAQGYRVTVVEQHDHPGGRCGLWEADGFRFDTGPTLLLMIDYLRQVFADAGRRLDDYLDLVQLDPNYRIYYPDGSTFDVSSRLNALLEGAEQIEPRSVATAAAISVAGGGAVSNRDSPSWTGTSTGPAISSS